MKSAWSQIIKKDGKQAQGASIDGASVPESAKLGAQVVTAVPEQLASEGATSASAASGLKKKRDGVSAERDLREASTRDPAQSSDATTSEHKPLTVNAGMLDSSNEKAIEVRLLEVKFMLARTDT